MFADLDSLLTDIFKNINTLLKVHHYTVTNLSKETEIAEHLLNDFLTGRNLHALDLDEYISISYVLKIPLNWIFMPHGMLKEALRENNLDADPT